MKIKQILILIVFVTGFCMFAPSAMVQAAQGDSCGDVVLQTNDEKCCDGMVTQMISCDKPGVDGITQLLLMAINLLTGAVGIAAVGGVIWGSILYTTAAGDPAKTKKGITVITDVVIGLIAFAAMWAVLNFLIPGGVFT